jgi:hypothetical protein
MATMSSFSAMFSTTIVVRQLLRQESLIEISLLTTTGLGGVILVMCSLKLHKTNFHDRHTN